MMNPQEADQRQLLYVCKRRSWARRVGRPYLGHEDPEPGELLMQDARLDLSKP